MSRGIARNALSNLSAGVLPALATLLTLPYVVHGLGSEAYGLFALVTSITGYFALIDINVTAGSVKHIAHHHALGEQDEVSSVFSFGLFVYAVIGALGAVLILLLAPWLAQQVFKVPAALLPVALEVLKLGAVGFLFGQLQAYLQSVPQALLRYDVSAAIESAFGLLVPLSGALLVALGFGLYELMLARVVLSALNCLMLLAAIWRLMPRLRLRRPDWRSMREVSSFSFYSFLSRMATVSYQQADKLIIGAFVGLSPLAYYTVASTLGNRVLGMMYRVSAIMFPVASALAAQGDRAGLRQLYLRMSRYVVFVNACALLLIAGFAHPLLAHWMGEAFAREGTLVLQLVAMAQFLDSLTNIPSLVNDGLGHPRVSGLFAITRALFGLVAVYFCVMAWGMQGAAASHLLSSALFTALFLLYVHGRTVPCTLAALWQEALRPSFLIGLAAGLLAWLAAQVAGASLPAMLALLAALVPLLGLAGLHWVLLPTDRNALALRWAAWRRDG